MRWLLFLLSGVSFAVGQVASEPDATHWEFRSWTTYTAPAWILLAAIAVSLLGMLRVIVRYHQAQKRRVAQWNKPRRRAEEWGAEMDD